MKELTMTSRRNFLKISGLAGGGLLLGFNLQSCKDESGNLSETEINAFIKIKPDGTVTIMAKNPEIGQGVRTSLPMILAEELDISWKKVTVEPAKLDDRLGSQFAGGSQGVKTNYENLRVAGAAVKSVLVLAAANRWGVKPENCEVKDGVITNDSNTLHYGEVASEAALLELPEKPVLKDPNKFSVIGKSTKDVDLEKIVTGQKLFGLDQSIEGMVYATVVKPEVFGSKVKSIDAEEAKKVAGVLDVFRIEGMENPTQMMDGVAVVATNIWSAFKAKKLVETEWELPSDYKSSASDLHKSLAEGISKKGQILREDGDVEAEFARSGEVIEALYEVPFVSHSQMEPMNFIADVKSDKITLIGPTQTPGGARHYANIITGIDKEKISVEFTRIGGGFGRRLMNDYANEAVYISHKIKKPVKLVWNRENDFLADYYRPAGCYQMKASLNGQEISAFDVKVCTTSRKLYALQTENAHKTEAFPDQEPAGMVPNLRVTYEPILTNVPVGPLRTPGVNATTFAYQCFIDELAEKAKMDPIDFQMNMIGEEDRDLPYDDHGGPSYNTGRLKNVINLVKEKSGWSSPAPSGVYRGFAAQMVFGAYVAQVAEVSVVSGKVKVNKVYCAVDCGRVINPLGANAQVQGGITDALSAALYEEIDMDGGKLIHQNFDRYQKLRMKDSPDVEVFFVESDASPEGLGEPSYPVLFPALCNAVYKATGIRVRSLPLKKHNLV
ncbi:MAG: molybdopterin-dependent oxidoreductase [bacterium]|nr:molybdopterin-dependent oxidoreductase [bacterium]